MCCASRTVLSWTPGANVNGRRARAAWRCGCSTARAWDEGGTRVALGPRSGEPVAGVGTIGRHPALFLYDPRPVGAR